MTPSSSWEISRTSHFWTFFGEIMTCFRERDVITMGKSLQTRGFPRFCYDFVSLHLL